MVYIFGQLFGRQSKNFQGRKSSISTDSSFQHQSKVLLKRVLFFLVVLFEIILKYSAVLVGFRQVYSKCFLLQKGERTTDEALMQYRQLLLTLLMAICAKSFQCQKDFSRCHHFLDILAITN